MGNTPSKKTSKQKPKPWLFSFGFPTPVVSKEIVRNSKYKQVIEKERSQLYAKLFKIKSHPCVVRIYETKICSTMCTTVMERMFGGELFAFLKDPSSRNLNESQVKNVLRPILLGLCHLHSNGIIHRDVKPENIMFRSKRRVNDPIDKDLDLVIIDLDSSITIDSPPREEDSKCCCFIGTPAYTSPEVLSGQKAIPASDLWAVGIILYILLTGTAPLPMKSMTSVKSARSVVLKHKEIGINFQKPIFDLSPLAYEFCVRLLAFEPDHRFEDAGQALRHPWIDDGSYARYIKEYQNMSTISDTTLEANSSISTSLSLYLDTHTGSSPISNENNTATHKVDYKVASMSAGVSLESEAMKSCRMNYSVEQCDEKNNNIHTYVLQNQMFHYY